LGQAHQRHAEKLKPKKAGQYKARQGSAELTELNCSVLLEWSKASNSHIDRKTNMLDATKYHFSKKLDIEPTWIDAHIAAGSAAADDDWDEHKLEIQVRIKPGARSEQGDSYQYRGSGMKIDELQVIAADIQEDDQVSVGLHVHKLEKLMPPQGHHHFLHFPDWQCTDQSPNCTRSMDTTLRWQCTEKTCQKKETHYFLCRGCKDYHAKPNDADVEYSEEYAVCFCKFMDIYDVMVDDHRNAIVHYRAAMKVLDHIEPTSVQMGFVCLQLGRVYMELHDLRSANQAFQKAVDVLSDKKFDAKRMELDHKGIHTENEERISEQELDRIKLICPLEQYALALEHCAVSCALDEAGVEIADEDSDCDKACYLLDKAMHYLEFDRLHGIAGLHNTQACFYCRAGRYDKGMELFKEAAQHAQPRYHHHHHHPPDPGGITALYNMALAESRQHNPNRAAECLKEAAAALSQAKAHSQCKAYKLINKRLKTVFDTSFSQHHGYRYLLWAWKKEDLEEPLDSLQTGDKFPSKRQDGQSGQGGQKLQSDQPFLFGWFSGVK